MTVPSSRSCQISVSPVISGLIYVLVFGIGGATVGIAGGIMPTYLAVHPEVGLTRRRQMEEFVDARGGGPAFDRGVLRRAASPAHAGLRAAKSPAVLFAAHGRRVPG